MKYMQHFMPKPHKNWRCVGPRPLTARNRYFFSLFFSRFVTMMLISILNKFWLHVHECLCKWWIGRRRCFVAFNSMNSHTEQLPLMFALRLFIHSYLNWTIQFNRKNEFWWALNEALHGEFFCVKATNFSQCECVCVCAPINKFKVEKV